MVYFSWHYHHKLVESVSCLFYLEVSYRGMRQSGILSIIIYIKAGSLLYLNIQNLWDVIPRQSYSSDVWKDHSAFICSIKQSQRNSLHFIFKNVTSNTYSFTILCHNLVQKFMKPTQHSKIIFNYQRCLAKILTTMKWEFGIGQHQ
jgi:uncharacterized protein YebE (UPF0316 family)